MCNINRVGKFVALVALIIWTSACAGAGEVGGETPATSPVGPTTVSVRALEVRIGLDDGTEFGAPVTQVNLGTQLQISFIYETNGGKIHRSLKAVYSDGTENVLVSGDIQPGAGKTGAAVTYFASRVGSVRFVGEIFSLENGGRDSKEAVLTVS